MARQTVTADRAVDDLRQLMDKVHFDDAMAPVLATVEMDLGRFVRVALTEVRRKKGLWECTPMSILAAMQEAAELGLEFGAAQLAYLLPFKRECTMVPGYRGLIQLAYRSSQVRDVEARAVYKGDHFAWRYGSERFLEHQPCGETDPTRIEHTYCIVRTTTGGGLVMEVVPRALIDQIKARSPAVKAEKKDSPWFTDFGAMAIKTAVRRVMRFAPSSARLARAVSLDDLAELYGSQGLEWHGPVPPGARDVTLRSRQVGPARLPETVPPPAAPRIPIQVRPVDVGEERLRGASARVARVDVDDSGRNGVAYFEDGSGLPPWRFQTAIYQIVEADQIDFSAERPPAPAEPETPPEAPEDGRGQEATEEPAAEPQASRAKKTLPCEVPDCESGKPADGIYGDSAVRACEDCGPGFGDKTHELGGVAEG